MRGLALISYMGLVVSSLTIDKLEGRFGYSTSLT